MSASSTLSGRLMASCFAALEALAERPLYTPEEKALCHRIVATTDPLAWEEQDSDDALAPGLWQKMQNLTQQQLQSQVVAGNLSGLSSVMNTPSDGYI